MTTRRPPFTVEMVTRRTPDAAWRKGRAIAVEVVRAAGGDLIALEFVEVGCALIEARLGVITVATITLNPAGGGFLWSIDLAAVPRDLRPAADLEKACAAVEYRVRQWCEAARLISARGKR
jgi:hypothetical protein